MDKNIRIILLVVLAVLLSAGFFYLSFILGGKNKKSKDVDMFSATDKEVVEILKTNKDVAEYTQAHSDFKIESREILKKESILAGQQGQNFQAVYSGLELEDNRYMKVQLINTEGNNGFITVIDSKDNSVPKAFGILLFKASTNQNGETTSP